jgi:hypothetical protein
MYSEKYSASAQRVLVAGPAYSHISCSEKGPEKRKGEEKGLEKRRG